MKKQQFKVKSSGKELPEVKFHCANTMRQTTQPKDIREVVVFGDYLVHRSPCPGSWATIHEYVAF